MIAAEQKAEASPKSAETKASPKSAPPKISVALLCGGENSRMGREKALLCFDGTTFLERLVREFYAFDEILVCARDETQAARFKSALETSVALDEPKTNESAALETNGAKIKFIADQTQGFGPLEGLRRALAECADEALFVCACDMPFAKKDAAEFLALFLCSDWDCYVPTSGTRPEPLCALYKKSVLPAVEKLLQGGERKISRLFDLVPTKFIPLEKSPLDKKIFLNVNAPLELQAARKPFVFCVAGLKNSGKTRLACALLSAAKSRGYECAAIKHDGHDFFCDAAGTDTFSFGERGTAATAIFSDKRFMLRSNLSARCGSEDKGGARGSSKIASELIEEIKALNPRLDFIIIEGLKNSDFPKIETLRKGASETPVCKKNVLCRAADFAFNGTDGIPTFSADDAASIFSFVEKYFLEEGALEDASR